MLMLRNMATDFLRIGYMQTTLAKAKAVQPIVEKLISDARTDNLARRRSALSFIMDKKVVSELYSTIGPRYREVNGGYTRLTKLGQRPGDAAHIAVLELVQHEPPSE